ncbi:hypothetical protein DMH20_25920 [Escherichia coli]|nr:hypothetical protein [Escherichia coli]
MRNAHTPVLLTTLTEPQVRSLAINNSQLAADVKTAWLKEEPSLLLFVDQPALSQLRDLVKIGATRKIRSEARHRLEENNDTTPRSKLQRKTHNIAALKLLPAVANNYMHGVALYAG